MPEVVLQTARMYFRKLTAQDALLLHELDSDPEVMRFISKGAPTPLELIQKDILPRMLSYASDTLPQGFWAACLRETRQFIGWFHLRPDKLEPGEMELGYRLKRRVWGQGLATEGSLALLEKGFAQARFPKICARTLVDNRASRRVMEKCRLRFEKEFTYPLTMIPDWTEEERRGVKYSLCLEDYRP